MKLIFLLFLALIITFAYEMLPKIIAQHVVKPKLDFYYGPAGLVREGMATLRRVTMDNYPYDYATHSPTNFAINNTISRYHDSLKFNKRIAQNIKNHPFPEFQAFNECN